MSNDVVTSKPPNTMRLALLIVDVHKRGLRGLNEASGSTPERAENFLTAVRETADMFHEKLGIRTYVVALDDHNHIFPDEITNPSQHNKDARCHLNRIRGLSGKKALNPRPHETIVSKNKNGVFVVDGFAKHLKQNGIDGVIIIGMDSSFCVAHSAEGAIQNGFHCIVLTDLLAQSWRDHEGKNGGDAAWHEAAVRRGLNETAAAKITFTTKEEFTDDPWKFASAFEPDMPTAVQPFPPRSANTLKY